MPQLNFRGEDISSPEEIAMLMSEFGLLYEKWGLRGSIDSDDDVLKTYDSEIKKLNAARGYVTADLVALKPETPNLDVICAKFDKEHHHVDDEVRFVVEGEGVFEIAADKEAKEWIKFKSEPGDLIVIPANRRHSFYLTEKRKIRCIRLFKNNAGWEAIYSKEN